MPRSTTTILRSSGSSPIARWSAVSSSLRSSSSAGSASPLARRSSVSSPPPRAGGARVAGGKAVQAQARGDRVEPRRELRLAPEFVDRAVDPEKHLLGDFLRLGAISEHPERDPEHPVL